MTDTEPDVIARPPAWLPNAIKVLRIVLIPVVVGLAAACQDAAPAARNDLRPATLGALLLLGGSDVVDGWVARRFGLGTPLGAVLDALADKLAQVVLVAYFALTRGPAFSQLPVWFWLLLVTRDVLLGLGWLVIRARRGRVDVVHEVHGKAASFLLFLLLVWVVAGGPESGVSWGSVVLATVIGLSTVRYVRAGALQLAG